MVARWTAGGFDAHVDIIRYGARMADEQAETGELTQRFRAFAEEVDPKPSRALPVGLIAAAGAVLMVLIVVVWVLLAS
jgi:hypothetical protein